MAIPTYVRDDTIFGAISASRNGQLRLAVKNLSFDLVKQVRSGCTLLVGEGNLSFARSLVRDHQIQSSSIVATTFEALSSIHSETLNNASWLEARGAIVIHGVNAKKLNSKFSGKKFETIMFQFPHTGRRKPVSGRNPNHVLLKEFLKSARGHLRQGGMVCVSHVQSPHYEGAFQLDLAAKLAGFNIVTQCPFKTSKFPSYNHVKTNENETGLSVGSNFVTSVFRPKLGH